MTAAPRTTRSVGDASERRRSALAEALAEAEASNTVCGAGVLASGVLFAYLFGMLGLIVGSSTHRSLPWAFGVAAGATMGVYVARGQGAATTGRASIAARELARTGSGFLARLPIEALEVSATLLLALTASLMYRARAPPVASYDHAAACVLVSVVAWLVATYGLDLLALAAAPSRWRAIGMHALRSMRRLVSSSCCSLAVEGEAEEDFEGELVGSLPPRAAAPSLPSTTRAREELPECSA